MKTKKKIDLSQVKNNVFDKYIYPVFAKEFLFSNDYEVFAGILSDKFILNTGQWSEVLKEWELKEYILK